MGIALYGIIYTCLCYTCLGDSLHNFAPSLLFRSAA